MSVLDRYPPSAIPADELDRLVNPQTSLDSMVKMIQVAHHKKGNNVSKEQVRGHLHKVAEDMGLTPSEGEGLFSDIASGIGHMVKNGGKRLASHVWHKLSEDPLGTLQKAIDIGSTLATTVPVI